MTDVRQLLENALSVTLVDWPSADIPRTLVAAGFEVNSVYLPGNSARRYLLYPTLADVPPEVPADDVLPPGSGGAGYLASVPLPGLPAQTDIVNVHRPEEELPGIIEVAARLGAAAVWRQRGRRSPAARRAAEAAGVELVEDNDIADTVRALAIHK